MYVLEDDFLANRLKVGKVDFSLPIRLQKRELLKSLGFPVGNSLISCLVSNEELLSGLLDLYMKKEDFPFLVLVSEKKLLSRVFPLFVVYSREQVLFRDHREKKSLLTYEEMLGIINGFDPDTWIELVDYVWGSDVIAGRLLYIDQGNQVVEIQRGVIPSQMFYEIGDNTLIFSGSFHYFDLSSADYLISRRSLQAAGYHNIFSYNSVQSVVSRLGEYIEGFSELADIASMPTLEFATGPNHMFVCIDIDWPSQWKKV